MKQEINEKHNRAIEKEIAKLVNGERVWAMIVDYGPAFDGFTEDEKHEFAITTRPVKCVPHRPFDDGLYDIHWSVAVSIEDVDLTDEERKEAIEAGYELYWEHVHLVYSQEQIAAFVLED